MATTPSIQAAWDNKGPWTGGVSPGGSLYESDRLRLHNAGAISAGPVDPSGNLAVTLPDGAVVRARQGPSGIRIMHRGNYYIVNPVRL